MVLIAVVGVWALVLGVNPGVALVAGAVGLLVVDRDDPRILDRAVARR